MVSQVSLMHLFWKDFQRNVQHSIHTSDITKRNSNVHFILGKTGHAWCGLTLRTVLYIAGSKQEWRCTILLRTVCSKDGKCRGVSESCEIQSSQEIKEGMDWSSDFQTPQSWFQKTHLPLFFQPTSWWLEIRWNTLPCVWCKLSNTRHSVSSHIKHGEESWKYDR